VRGSVTPRQDGQLAPYPAGGSLIELLLRQAGKKPREAYLFARENGLPPDDRDLQQHVFRPTAKKVGIYHPGFGMHSFRRLNISRRQEVGATPFEAMRAAGHANVSTTWLYTVTDAAREKKQVARLWERLAGGKPSGPVQ